MQNSFTYTMVSEVDQGGNFSNTCNELLDFQSTPYEVCLREIFISYGAWDNVRAGNNWLFFDFSKDGSVFYNKEEGFIDQWREYMRPGKYDTLKAYVDELNVAVSAMLYTARVSKDDIAFKLEKREKQSAEIDEKTEKPKTKEVLELTFQIPTVTYATLPTFPKLVLEVSPAIGYSLGITNLLSIKVPNITNGWSLDVTDADVAKNNVTLLWVFADFIQPTMAGDQLFPILRMFPIQVTTGTLEHTIFSHQHYVPVKRTKIQQFGISIRENLDGDPLQMYGRIILTLHFQKIINVDGE